MLQQYNGTAIPSLTCRGWRVGRQFLFGGGHDVVYYVCKASYDPPEQPLLNREVRGRPRVGRGLATPTIGYNRGWLHNVWNLCSIAAVRLTSQVTYPFGRRCTAMVWLALTICVDVSRSRLIQTHRGPGFSADRHSLRMPEICGSIHTFYEPLHSMVQ